ncbi:MAG TPA: ATP-binding cassette domain-containing protein [Verrucomicrobiae bacterium]|jgi:molybdate transport system ATP-binding protein
MTLLLKGVSLPLTHFKLEMDVELHGRATAVFGPSGAGKTSLLDLVAGLRRATSAFIQFGNQILCDTQKKYFMPPRERNIGYVPQNLALFPHLSVRQNLLYGRKPGGAHDPLFNLNHVAEILEIEALIPGRLANLSGGEIQRIALARALLASPRLLLLDEPFVSLGAPLKAKILPYFVRIRDEFKIPMLFVTHDRADALTLADEVVLLEGGKILQTGPILEVFNHPANARVTRLVGA